MPRDRLHQFQILASAAALVTWILIVLGGAVCLTGSAKSIPDWPTNFGGFLPPADYHAAIEYAHRLLAILAGTLIALSGAMGLVFFRKKVGLWLQPCLTVVALIPVVILGRKAVLSSLTQAQALLDLGCALAVLGLTVSTAVMSRTQPIEGTSPRSGQKGNSLPILILTTGICVFTALDLTVIMGRSDDPSICLGWPSWLQAASLAWPPGLPATIQYSSTLLSAILVFAIMARAWTTWRKEPAVLTLATVTLAVFISGTLTTELTFLRRFPEGLLLLRVVLASGLWVSLIALGVLSVRTKQPDPRQPADGDRRVGDLIAITRPGVVLFLLAAAATGAIVSARPLHTWALFGWSMLGLALATSGSQALNQYLEHRFDRLMSRTSSRPLPAGRLSPAEALAWGSGLCVLSMAVLIGFNGWRTGLLALLGIFWYVVVYTLILKRRTPQSIVVGGVAGGLLPLIGSLAVSGRISPAAFFLGISIFLWSAPHFWTLAIRHSADYAKAGFPVAPVVLGIRKTWNLILVFGTLLIVSTLVPVFRHLTGMIYLVSAGLLGLTLAAFLWGAWRTRNLESARFLYRVLSIYLGALLVALIADSMIR